MSLIAAKKKLLMAQGGGGLDVSDVFNTSLWTGTGAARTITTGIDSGEGSLVWCKVRSGGSTPHVLYDSLRGTSSSLSTNTSDAANSNSDRVTSFLSTGYSLGTNDAVNNSGSTYVGWQFRRAENFFDIVQYAGNATGGRQIAHNLGVKPGMIFVKRVDATADWQVYHQAQGATQYSVLNSTAAFTAATSRWNNTEPTPSVFTVGNDATVNAIGGTYIAYIFAHDPSPEGLIQCGSYVGNSSATGPVVNLGWRPQYLMIKRATGGIGGWYLIDSARNDGRFLIANSSNAETVIPVVSFLTSGFQIILTDASLNASGSEYIYMAIREA